MVPVDRPRRAGSYGVDAPYAPIGMSVGALFCFLGAIGRTSAAHPAGGWWLWLLGLLLLGMAGSYVYTTRRGKFAVWADIVDSLRLRGDERVLDLGCGRGAVLLEVARHLASGRAVGVDLWKSMDQSGNDEQATRANARAEGVADRVELHTGDMTRLPFDDARFDLVVSSLAIHNISSAEGRMRAIDEVVRVLRPGGRVALADFRHTEAYRDRLATRGMLDPARRNLGWRFWYGGPPWATHLVTAIKPG